jgi:hypothetical protein
VRIAIVPDPRRVLGYEISIKQTDEPLPASSQGVVVELKASQYDEWFRARTLAEAMRAEIAEVYRNAEGGGDDPGD